MKSITFIITLFFAYMPFSRLNMESADTTSQGACLPPVAQEEHETSASPSLEMTDIVGPGPAQVLRIRGPDDMKHVISYLKVNHAREFRQLEQKWDREPPLNSDDCEYLKRVESQRTPFNAPRSVLLGLILLVVFIRGCTYWGWNGLQDMLYKSGAFLWRCDPYEPDISYQRVGQRLYLDCPARKNAINDLYTAAFASNFIFSAAGGIILDWVGPKLTLLGAILVDGAGWGMLAGASERVASYVPALVFIGMAADPGYLSLLCVANLFPKNESTVMGVMGSVRSLSFAVPVIMGQIFQSPSMDDGSLWKVLVFYIVVCLGICMAICLLFVPLKPFKGAEDFRRVDRLEQVKAMRRQLLMSLPPSFFQPWTRSTTNRRHLADRYKLVLTKDEFKTVTQTLIKVEKHEAMLEQEATFVTALLDPRFLLLLPIFVVNLLRVEFYTKSNKEQMAMPDGRNLYTLFSIMNILSFIPGPFMGYLSDRLGVLAVLCFLNFAGIGMYALLMPISLPSKGVSVFFFWLYASFVLSSIYCYIKTHFPNKLFGSLAGICSLVGGCFALTSIGWYKLSTETLRSLKPHNFWPVNGVMIAGGVLVMFFLGALFFLDRQSKERRAREKESKETDVAATEMATIMRQASEQIYPEVRGGGTIELLNEDEV